MKRTFFLLSLIAVTALAASPPPKARPAAPTTQPSAAQPRTFYSVTVDAINATFDGLEAGGNWPEATIGIDRLFDQVIAYAPDQDRALFTDAAYARRLIHFLGAVPDPSARVELLKFLRKNPELSRTLAFVAQPGDQPAAVYAMLDKLRSARGDKLDKYAQLAAAICVVHDGPFSRQVNEQSPTSPDPIDIFDYFIANEGKMFFGIKGVPAELLIFVVDTTASIKEMQWALQKYAGDNAVGRHFFDIRYDFDNFLKGKPKKISGHDYTLPNILQYGGICADQAYFASTVGKAIGVPTTYTTGRSAEGGHAYVGFLQQSGRQGLWNFNSGRYDDYKDIRGVVINPQTREAVPDAIISLSAELIGTSVAQRQAATAMTDAAIRLIRAGKETGAFTPKALESGLIGGLTKPRDTSTDAILSLLGNGLSQNPGYAMGWLAVRQMAVDGRLTLANKTQWADRLLRLSGDRYPDFAAAVLTPMIQTIDDVNEQDKLWNKLFTLFKARRDLAAEIRMQQAEMWEKHKDLNKAGQCYEDVINQFANDGPFVTYAIVRAEKLLKDLNTPDKVVRLYEVAWSRISKPKYSGTEMSLQSNWYRVGSQYLAKLEAAGMKEKAAKVREQLETVAAAAP